MIRLTSGYAIAAIALQFGWAAMPISAQVLVLVSDAEVAAERAAPRPAVAVRVRAVPVAEPQRAAHHVSH